MASALAVLLIAGLLTSLIYQRWTFKVQRDINAMHQNIRSSMETLARDVSMARYGIRVADVNLDQWIDWEPGFNTNPQVIEGGTGPDELLIASALGDPVAELGTLSTNGSHIIQLRAGEGALFTGKNRNVIFIGQTETAKILTVAGDTLVVTRVPGEQRGLKFNHPAGTPVELVRTVRYRIFHQAGGFPADYVLLREDSLQQISAEWQQVHAIDVEDLQIAVDGKSLNVALIGRTPRPDFRYQHPDVGDGYRRWTLERTIYARNARLLP